MKDEYEGTGWFKCEECSKIDRDRRRWGKSSCENCYWEYTIDHAELHELAETIFKADMFEEERELLLKAAHNVGLLIENDKGELVINPKLRK